MDVFRDGFAEVAQCGFGWWQRQVQPFSAPGRSTSKEWIEMEIKKISLFEGSLARMGLSVPLCAPFHSNGHFWFPFGWCSEEYEEATGDNDSGNRACGREIRDAKCIWPGLAREGWVETRLIEGH